MTKAISCLTLTRVAGGRLSAVNAAVARAQPSAAVAASAYRCNGLVSPQS